MKKLIVYYSYEGRTEYLADNLAKKIGADVLSLRPVKEKKTSGFMKFVWGGYQAVMKKKPDLEAYDINPNDYETIVFASPVWAGTFTPPFRTFLEQEDLLAKKVAFFFTHEGGIGKTVEHFTEALGDNHLLGYTDINTNKVPQEDNWQQVKIWAEQMSL